MKRNCLLSILQRRLGTVGVSEKIHVQNLGLLAVKNHHLESDTQLKSAKGRKKRKQQAERREEAKIINKCLYKCLYVFFSLPSLSPSFLPSSLLSSSPSLFFAGRAKIQPGTHIKHLPKMAGVLYEYQTSQ